MFVEQFFHLLAVFIVINGFACILLHPLAQTGEKLQSVLIVLTVFFCEACVFKKAFRLQSHFQTTGKLTQGLVKIITHFQMHIERFTLTDFQARHQDLSQLFNICLVFHILKNRPQAFMQTRQAFVFGTHLMVQTINVIDVITTLGFGRQILIIGNGGIQLRQNPTVINQQTKFLLVMQTVYPSNRLNQIVFFQWLVNVEHRIFRLIKTSQKLVYHNQQFQF